ncbi:TPA_asm: maturation protein [ssRNA phage SRR6960551_8]|uniref:Maturation protein n=1 Tax=ssRNA phage SRR6960551_8 TaxID=2786559 RepID=A0A8S5L067_9VIRU|nr:maturation protein [ssRNA phage SRR6960551_8]DAD51025.1 TPA_asm: maturation protein [ssRNA phage SRR6960551_8]
MAMESNASSRYMPLITYDIHGNVTSSQDQQHHVRDFTCNPSPCHNTGGKARHYSAHKYQLIEEMGCVGEQVYGQWGRDPLDTESKTQWLTWGSRGCYGLGSTWNRFTYSPSVVLQETARNKALGKLYDQIKNSEVSLNTSVGEGRETFEMLHGIVKKFRTEKFRTLVVSTQELIRALKKDPRGTVSSGWLGWQVGWKPFLQDVDNIFSHFTSLQTQPYLDFVGAAKARSSEIENASKSSGGVTETFVGSYRYEFGVKYRITDLTLFNTWQLGLVARPTLLWELTRLSFVVDYFVNIGQYLENLESSIAGNGFTMIEGFQTYTSQQTWNSNWNASSPIPPFPGIGATTGAILIKGYNSCFKRIVKKERSLLYDLPRPAMPTFKIPKASAQILTCAALLSNLVPYTRR